jgi:integrase
MGGNVRNERRDDRQLLHDGEDHDRSRQKQPKAGAAREGADLKLCKPVKSAKKATRKAAERSNVPCSPHVFRHTAGVWMAQADVPIQKTS